MSKTLDQETIDRIHSLPRWAKEIIKDLGLQRDAAVSALHSHISGQEVSPIYYDDLVCTGERQGPEAMRFYINHYKVQAECGGVQVEVVPADGKVVIRYARTNGSAGDVAIIPRTTGSLEIVAPEEMYGLKYHLDKPCS